MSLRIFGKSLLAVLAVSLSACGGGGAGSTVARPSHSRGHPAGLPVDMAMSLAPRNTSTTAYSFEFTDHRAVASGIGVDFRRGSPSQQDAAFGNRLNAAGGVWIGDEPSLWHVADVQWQSTAGPTAGTPVLATGLRPTFNLDAIGRKFANCNYEKREVAGAVVYAGSGSAVDRCAGAFGDQAPVEAQIALLPSEHVVLLSGSPEAMDSAIRREGDLHRDVTTTALIRQLAGYPAFTTASGPSFCRRVSNAFIGSNATPALVRKALATNPPGAAYTGFAFGSRFTNDRATASIVFRYSDPQTARVDLPFRVHALRTEVSPQTNRPYADLVRVDTARAVGQNVVLDVAPPSSKRLSLYDMWLQLDLAFARC